jgi:hypothetical protein
LGGVELALDVIADTALGVVDAVTEAVGELAEVPVVGGVTVETGGFTVGEFNVGGFAVEAGGVTVATAATDGQR